MYFDFNELKKQTLNTDEDIQDFIEEYKRSINCRLINWAFVIKKTDKLFVILDNIQAKKLLTNKKEKEKAYKLIQEFYKIHIKGKALYNNFYTYYSETENTIKLEYDSTNNYILLDNGKELLDAYITAKFDDVFLLKGDRIYKASEDKFMNCDNQNSFKILKGNNFNPFIGLIKSDINLKVDFCLCQSKEDSDKKTYYKFKEKDIKILNFSLLAAFEFKILEDCEMLLYKEKLYLVKTSTINNLIANKNKEEAYNDILENFSLIEKDNKYYSLLCNL